MFSNTYIRLLKKTNQDVGDVLDEKRETEIEKIMLQYHETQNENSFDALVRFC